MVRRSRLGLVTVGILLQLAAFLCFAMMDTSAKWLVGAAIPAIQVAFLRYLVHFSWALLLFLPSQGLSLFRSGNPKLQILRAVSLLIGTVLNFSALAYLPLTVTISIFFAAPLVVCLLSRPVLGEQVGIRRFAAVAAGLVGVLIIVDPWGESFDWHVIMSLGAVLGVSFYFVLTRLIAGVDSNAATQCISAGTSSLLLMPFAIAFWEWPTSGLDWGLLFLIGSFGMLGHSMLTRAHDFAEASVLAPMVYSQIIYVTVLGWLVFGSVPTKTTLLGVLIIVASGLYVWFRERHINPAVGFKADS